MIYVVQLYLPDEVLISVYSLSQHLHASRHYVSTRRYSASVDISLCRFSYLISYHFLKIPFHGHRSHGRRNRPRPRRQPGWPPGPTGRRRPDGALPARRRGGLREPTALRLDADARRELRIRDPRFGLRGQRRLGGNGLSRHPAQLLHPASPLRAGTLSVALRRLGPSAGKSSPATGAAAAPSPCPTG